MFGNEKCIVRLFLFCWLICCWRTWNNKFFLISIPWVIFALWSFIFKHFIFCLLDNFITMILYRILFFGGPNKFGVAQIVRGVAPPPHAPVWLRAWKRNQFYEEKRKIKFNEMKFCEYFLYFIQLKRWSNNFISWVSDKMISYAYFLLIYFNQFI